MEHHGDHLVAAGRSLVQVAVLCRVLLVQLSVHQAHAGVGPLEVHERRGEGGVLALAGGAALPHLTPPALPCQQVHELEAEQERLWPREVGLEVRHVEHHFEVVGALVPLKAELQGVDQVWEQQVVDARPGVVAEGGRLVGEEADVPVRLVVRSEAVWDCWIEHYLVEAQVGEAEVLLVARDYCFGVPLTHCPAVAQLVEEEVELGPPDEHLADAL